MLSDAKRARRSASSISSRDIGLPATAPRALTRGMRAIALVVPASSTAGLESKRTQASESNQYGANINELYNVGLVFFVVL